MDLSHRIVARYLQKRADTEDLGPYLRTFRNIVDNLAKYEQEALQTPDDFGTRVNTGAAAKAAFSFVRRYGIPLLFLGLLKQYQMDTKERKVVERAAKAFAKTRIQVPKKSTAAFYLKMLTEYRTYLQAAERVIAKGLAHTDEGSETVLQAGPFTLINAGGFDQKTMEAVQKVIEQAAQKLRAKSLGKVCYGNIQITNTIGRSTRVLAFYLVNKDEMYVRANLKGKQGPAVMSVMHELGHRLHYKFLRSKNNEITSIYNRLKGENDAALDEAVRDSSNYPEKGTTIADGRKTWVVDGWQLNLRTSEPDIQLYLQKDPSKKARLPMRAWLQENLSTSATFVSQYASTKPEENFAEMVAYYCEGLLPDDQVRMLKSVL